MNHKAWHCLIFLGDFQGTMASNISPSAFDKEQVGVPFSCSYFGKTDLVVDVVNLTLQCDFKFKFSFLGVFWLFSFSSFWMCFNNSCGNGADIWNGWKGDGVSGWIIQQVGFPALACLDIVCCC